MSTWTPTKGLKEVALEPGPKPKPMGAGPLPTKQACSCGYADIESGMEHHAVHNTSSQC